MKSPRRAPGEPPHPVKLRPPGGGENDGSCRCRPAYCWSAEVSSIHPFLPRCSQLGQEWISNSRSMVFIGKPPSVSVSGGSRNPHLQPVHLQPTTAPPASVIRSSARTCVARPPVRSTKQVRLYLRKNPDAARSGPSDSRNAPKAPQADLGSRRRWKSYGHITVDRTVGLQGFREGETEASRADIACERFDLPRSVPAHPDLQGKAQNEAFMLPAFSNHVADPTFF